MNHTILEEYDKLWSDETLYIDKHRDREKLHYYLFG